MNATLVWFRQDLRLHDNPALEAAMARGGAVVPLYLLDDAGEGRWALGGASRWWLHRALAALDASLRERGSRLLLARGNDRAAWSRARFSFLGTGESPIREADPRRKRRRSSGSSRRHLDAGSGLRVRWAMHGERRGLGLLSHRLTGFEPRCLSEGLW